MKQHCSLGLLVIALLGLQLGCKPNNPQGRQVVTGNITLNGTPLESGFVRFDPVARGSGLLAESQIKDGAYAFTPKNGPSPGEYRVMIFSPQQSNASDGGGLTGNSSASPQRERIPPQFNLQTTLRATVTDGGPNTFDFEVPNP